MQSSGADKEQKRREERGQGLAMEDRLEIGRDLLMRLQSTHDYFNNILKRHPSGSNPELWLVELQQDLAEFQNKITHFQEQHHKFVINPSRTTEMSAGVVAKPVFTWFTEVKRFSKNMAFWEETSLEGISDQEKLRKISKLERSRKEPLIGIQKNHESSLLDKKQAFDSIPEPETISHFVATFEKVDPKNEKGILEQFKVLTVWLASNADKVRINENNDSIISLKVENYRKIFETSAPPVEEQNENYIKTRKELEEKQKEIDLLNLQMQKLTSCYQEYKSKVRKITTKNIDEELIRKIGDNPLKQKQKYIEALRKRVETMKPDERVALANYLFNKENHPLKKEKRFLFFHNSNKTTHIATAQGILISGLGDEHKKDILFTQKNLDRSAAKEAYNEEAKTPKVR